MLVWNRRLLLVALVLHLLVGLLTYLRQLANQLTVKLSLSWVLRVSHCLLSN